MKAEGTVQELEDGLSLRGRKALEPLKSEHHSAIGMDRRDGSGFAKELIARDLESPCVADHLLKRNSTDTALDLRNALGVSSNDFRELPLAEAALFSERPDSLADLFFGEDDFFRG